MPKAKTVGAMQTSEISYETKMIIVVLLLLLFYPVGLILMWLWMKDWPVWVKILVSLPILFGVLALIGFILAILFAVKNYPSFDSTNRNHRMWRNYRYQMNAPSNSSGSATTY